MLWISHIDGLPFRKLANIYHKSPIAACRIVEDEMDNLPPNEFITQKYCVYNTHILHIDGKYIKVRGYEKKIPFIYSIDRDTHDIPVGILTLGENYDSFYKIFSHLKGIGYYPVVVISDEHPAVPMALERIFPRAKHQLCHTHYHENIRTILRIRTETMHRSFFGEYMSIFEKGLSLKHRLFIIDVLKKKYSNNKMYHSICDDIVDKYSKLFIYERIPHCPHSNNIIEAFNSHLNGRLKTIKGFSSFHHAERWINAYMVRRRTKPFTDCEYPFTHLNNKCSLEVSLKEGFDYVDVYTEIIMNVKKKRRKMG